jgi:hypothetical protein
MMRQASALPTLTLGPLKRGIVQGQRTAAKQGIQTGNCRLFELRTIPFYIHHGPGRPSIYHCGRRQMRVQIRYTSAVCAWGLHIPQSRYSLFQIPTIHHTTIKIIADLGIVCGLKIAHKIPIPTIQRCVIHSRPDS